MSHGHDHHEKSGSDWLLEHVAGFIIPFGQWFEKRVEKNAHTINELYRQVGKVYVYIAAPIIIVAFSLYIAKQLFA